jgi:hypothetical protein
MYLFTGDLFKFDGKNTRTLLLVAYLQVSIFCGGVPC